MRTPGPTSILWLVLAHCCRGGRRRNGAQLLRRVSFVFPVVVLLISAWTWRCVVLMPGTGQTEKTTGWAATAVVFNLLLIPFLFSYLSVVFSDPSGPGRRRLQEFAVPEEPLAEDDFLRFEEALRAKARALRIRDLDEDGAPRHCPACAILKPDRCHHCPICQACVLKMDHHCPWVNNCVGHGNHKQFMLFLFWASLELSFTAAAQIRHALPCIGAMPNGVCSTEVFYNHLLTWSLLLCVGAFFGFHVYLIVAGRTTFELCTQMFHDSSRGSRRYDMGWRHNLLEVFGEKWWLWLIPIPNTDGGDGLHWQKFEEDLEAGEEESALRQSDDPRL